jgi:lysophospholipase L1-like esterase
MKCKFFSFYILVLLLTLNVSFSFYSVAFAATCPNGTIAIWSLEESAPPYKSDISSENEAICESQCPTRIAGEGDNGDDRGVVGVANRFSDSGLRIPNSAAFNWTGIDSFSVELWVRNTNTAGLDQILIGRTDGIFSWNISLHNDNTVGFHLDDSIDSISLGSSKRLSTSQSPLGARWHHVAAVRNGASGEIQLFVDGELEGSETRAFPGGFSSDSASLAIGWSGDPADGRKLNADLDEIAIYGYPLTQTVIRSHYYLARHYCELYVNPVNIMPLGDSITFDNRRGETRDSGRDIGVRISYRYELWKSLTGNFHWFDFVGNRRTGYRIDPAFDQDNAGFPGITPWDLLHLLQYSINRTPDPDILEGERGRYLSHFPSDVILLHIGTNGLDNLSNEDELHNPIANVRRIFEEIDRQNIHATVLVARIIHNTAENPDDDSSDTHRFNDAVEEMVVHRIAAGDKLLMVDMEDGAGITYVEGVDMWDDLHPNSSGYTKMASQWFAGLQKFLTKVALPEITSSPVVEVAAGQKYQYQVTAGGTPPPHFRLEQAPDGMTIDADSGLINWTAPNSVGVSVNVSVVAQNIDSTDTNAGWARTAVQNFSISTVENSNGDGGGGGSSGGCFIQNLVFNKRVSPPGY